MDIKKRFWERIKELRKKKWFSQEELAAKSGLHRTYISDIERWEKNLSLENIEKLSKSLEVNLAHLFTNLDDKN